MDLKLIICGNSSRNGSEEGLARALNLSNASAFRNSENRNRIDISSPNQLTAKSSYPTFNFGTFKTVTVSRPLSEGKLNSLSKI